MPFTLLFDGTAEEQAFTFTPMWNSERAVNGWQPKTRFRECNFKIATLIIWVTLDGDRNMPSIHPQPHSHTWLCECWWITQYVLPSLYYIAYRSADDWIMESVVLHYSVWFSKFAHYEGSCEVKELRVSADNTLVTPFYRTLTDIFHLFKDDVKKEKEKRKAQKKKDFNSVYLCVCAGCLPS